MNSLTPLGPVNRSAEHHTTGEPPDDARRVVSRRDFLATSALAASALGLGVAGSPAAESDATPRFPLIGFSKPFQKLTPDQTAELAGKVGWDGLEIPVRAKGQVEPERAPDELP